MSLSLKRAARKVLLTAGQPLQYQEITRRILDRTLSSSRSEKPGSSLIAVLAVDAKRNSAGSTFMRVTSGLFGLRGKGGGTAASTEVLGLNAEAFAAVQDSLDEQGDE